MNLGYLSLKIREVKRVFTNKLGAQEDDSGDHIYFYLDFKGSQYTVGKLSHSWKADLNDSQVMMLSRKLCLKKREFEWFVSCTLTAKDTVDLWQARRRTY